MSTITDHIDDIKRIDSIETIATSHTHSYLPLSGGTLTGTLAANAGISQDGHVILSGSDTWLRTSGSDGWYSSTYGGGWHMTDATYVRTYNNKSIYTGGDITLDGNLSGMSGFDLGQSWQNMTSQRALGVTYTNTTGKPIFIIIQGHNGGYSFNLQMIINGVYMCSDYRPAGDGNMRFIIANGNTYKATGFPVLGTWHELR